MPTYWQLVSRVLFAQARRVSHPGDEAPRAAEIRARKALAATEEHQAAQAAWRERVAANAQRKSAA